MARANDRDLSSKRRREEPCKKLLVQAVVRIQLNDNGRVARQEALPTTLEGVYGLRDARCMRKVHLDIAPGDYWVLVAAVS